MILPIKKNLRIQSVSPQTDSPFYQRFGPQLLSSEMVWKRTISCNHFLSLGSQTTTPQRDSPRKPCCCCYCFEIRDKESLTVFQSRQDWAARLPELFIRSASVTHKAICSLTIFSRFTFYSFSFHSLVYSRVFTPFSSRKRETDFCHRVFCTSCNHI